MTWLSCGKDDEVGIPKEEDDRLRLCFGAHCAGEVGEVATVQRVIMEKKYMFTYTSL